MCDLNAENQRRCDYGSLFETDQLNTFECVESLMSECNVPTEYSVKKILVEFLRRVKVKVKVI